ncbi:hypothetical protein JHK85_001303 [Glycine max]|uniref:Uncharacterized protein n=2 Tax=Glycine subgen. Soja TaxID=1462606 RepID=K7K329_SOYBN|nr:hypothetical protein JHK85_001303 [Glycine max]KAG5088653.1 hypothetical protein JHK86_001265 [Glycine max]KAH1162550.1 hypothetical protein GYH30_001159 [Glycine max]RZC29386.1 Protein TIC 214 [Glycine soja]
MALIHYSQQSDFQRDIIKESIRAQRCKTVTWKFFQKRVHSPLFWIKLKNLFFCFDSFKSMKIFFMFKIWMRKNSTTSMVESDVEALGHYGLTMALLDDHDTHEFEQDTHEFTMTLMN